MDQLASDQPFGFDLESGLLHEFVLAAVNAFFDNDLYHSVRQLLSNSKGSFGLSVSSSLDSHRQFVMAARGQTMSVAFYPQLGAVLYGSEQVCSGVALCASRGGGSPLVLAGWAAKGSRENFSALNAPKSPGREVVRGTGVIYPPPSFWVVRVAYIWTGVLKKVTSQRLLDQSQAGVYRGTHHIPPILGLFGAIHVPYPKGLIC